jgi:hypothetical protein
METIAPKKGEPSQAGRVKEMSRMKYGRPKEDVEKEMMKRYEKQPVTNNK